MLPSVLAGLLLWVPALPGQPMLERVTVRGSVLAAATGKPIAGAAAMLRLLNGKGEATGNTLPVPGMSGTPTDADGAFAIPGVPEGTYYLSISAEGFDSFGQKLVVRPDAPPRLDAKLNKAKVLTLRVLAPNGKPAASARVLVAMAYAGSSPPGRPYASDAQGCCTLSPEKPVKLLVRVAGLGCAYLEPTPKQLETGRLDLQLVPAGSVSGVVTDKTTRQAMAGAQLGLRGLGKLQEKPPLNLAPPITAQADAQGRFRFQDVPPGTWAVDAAEPRLLQAEARTLEVKPGQALADVAVTAVLAPRVSGRLLGVTGSPLVSVPEVTLQVWTRRADGKCLPSPLAVTVDPEGRFAFPLRTVDRTRLAVLVPGEGWGLSPWLEPAPGKDLQAELRLQPLLTLSGRAQIEGTGKPLAAAIVRAEPTPGPDPTAAGTTAAYADAAGTFTCRDLAPAVYSVSASAFGYEATTPVTVDLKTGGTVADVRLTFRPATKK